MKRIGDNEAFHASIIASYVSYCGLATKFQYLYGEVPQFQSAKMINGTMLHKAIETIHSEGLFDADEDTLRQLVVDSLRYAEFEKDPETPVYWPEEEKVKDKMISEAVTILYHYIQVPDNRRCQVLLNEAEFRIRIGKYPFEGRIDQLRRYTDGIIELVDFKSGIRGPADNEMRRIYQFAVYAIACRDGEFTTREGETIRIGKLPDKITWYHLRDHLEYQKPTPVVPVNERNGDSMTNSYRHWFENEADTYTLDEIREITGNNRLNAKNKVYFNTGHQKGPGKHTIKLTKHRIKVMENSIKRVCKAIRFDDYYPNPSTCSSCRFIDTCDLYLDGRDQEFVESQDFLPKEAYQLT